MKLRGVVDSSNIAEAAIAASSHVDQPIRAEIFGSERLQQHAESLAAADRVTETADAGTESSSASPRQRARTARRVSQQRRGGRCEARDHARRGMVPRQLPRRGRAAPGDPRPPSGELLPPAAEDRGGPPRGNPARLWAGLGLRGPHRQPLRAGDAPALRPGLPARPASRHRRALGGAHSPADGPRGELAAAVSADRRLPRGADPGRRAGRSSARPERSAGGEHGEHPAFSGRRAPEPGVRRPAGAAATRPGRVDHASAGVAQSEAQLPGNVSG